MLLDGVASVKTYCLYFGHLMNGVACIYVVTRKNIHDGMAHCPVFDNNEMDDVRVGVHIFFFDLYVHKTLHSALIRARPNSSASIHVICIVMGSAVMAVLVCVCLEML